MCETENVVLIRDNIVTDLFNMVIDLFTFNIFE